MASPVLLVIGAGPGISGSLARLYAADGYDVGLVGVDAGVLADLVADLRPHKVRVEAAQIDITDTAAARSAITMLASTFGRVDVLHFNPSRFREKDPLLLGVRELLDDVALGVGGLLTAVQAVRPFMSAGARVTATGSVAADLPWHRAASLGVQKAGLRNLVRSLDTTLAPDGIRATTVTVRGSLSEEGPFSPGRVAAAIREAARQDADTWQVEVPYDG